MLWAAEQGAAEQLVAELGAAEQLVAERGVAEQLVAELGGAEQLVAELGAAVQRVVELRGAEQLVAELGVVVQRVAELGVAERLVAEIEVVAQRVAVGPPWKRRRAEVSSVETGPAPFALRPYVGHSGVFVGRSLWCLKCFEVPGRIFQTWRHGRCDGSRPAVAMPPSLRDAILRAPIRPDLPTEARERWTELATFARKRQL